MEVMGSAKSGYGSPVGPGTSDLIRNEVAPHCSNNRGSKGKPRYNCKRKQTLGLIVLYTSTQ